MQVMIVIAVVIADFSTVFTTDGALFRYFMWIKFCPWPSGRRRCARRTAHLCWRCIFTVDHDDFNRRIALSHGLAKLFRIEVREAAVEKEYLPEPLFQVHEGFGASCGVFDATRPRKQAVKNSLAQYRTGARHKNTVRVVGRGGQSCHADDLKRRWLESD